MKRLITYIIVPILVWIALFLLFQTTYAYHFYYWEQHQLYLPTNVYTGDLGWLDCLSEWITQWYFYLYAGPLILSFAITLTWTLFFHLGTNITSGKISKGIVFKAIITIALLIANIFIHFTDRNMLKVQLLAIILLLAIWCASFFYRKLSYLGILALLAVCPFWDEIRFAVPNSDYETQLAVENEYYFGNYEKAEEIIVNAERKSDMMIFYYNLMMAKREALPDHLFDMPKQVLGTELTLDENSPRAVFRIMPDFYYEVGDMTYAERASLLCMVFTRNNIYTPMMKRLVEINLVSGDTLVANKYLRILKQAPAYRHWAEMHTPGQMPPRIEQDILRRRQFVNVSDSIRLGADSHAILERLLDTNKNNIVALDYLLCTYMLERNEQGFKNAFYKYATRTTELYESGLR